MGPKAVKPVEDIDLSEFTEGDPVGPQCAISVLPLTPEQREKLGAALATQLISTAKIHRVVKSWGYSVGASTIGRHRREGCVRCGL